MAEAREPLTPIDPRILVKALSSCLTLVAGVGMSTQERDLWLTSATITLKEWPEDLIRIGVERARKVADHPAKIVPTIVAETETMLKRRKDVLGKLMWIAKIEQDERWRDPLEDFDEADRCTPEQAAQIIAEVEAEMGVKLRPDIQQYVRKHEGPPRKPTRQDYIDMGIDPAVLDEPKGEAA
jgi:predicted secreted protein